jgi:transposase
MRGDDRQQAGMFSYLSPEQRVPADHPLRPIRALVDDALCGLSGQFATLYARRGRPSIAPEKLLRALLLQVLFSIRSERQLMEQLDYNLLYRWFVGLNMDDPVWDATTFSKNRERLLAGDIAQGFFDHVLAQAYARDLVSNEHFSVDGTLLEAWASQKSFQPQDPPADPPAAGERNPTVNFRGRPRTNDTHASTTDPEARLYKKAAGHEAKLAYLGHALMEHRHGLAVQTCVTQATGTAERAAALAMLETLPGAQRKTVAADKAYDTQAFVTAVRALGITPHVTQNTAGRASAIDGRTTAPPGYTLSLRTRKRIEEIFGWLKTVAGLRKLRHRGVGRVWWMFTFAVTGYNLVRIRNLERQAAAP